MAHKPEHWSSNRPLSAKMVDVDVIIFGNVTEADKAIKAHVDVILKGRINECDALLGLLTIFLEDKKYNELLKDLSGCDKSIKDNLVLQRFILHRLNEDADFKITFYEMVSKIHAKTIENMKANDMNEYASVLGDYQYANQGGDFWSFDWLKGSSDSDDFRFYQDPGVQADPKSDEKGEGWKKTIDFLGNFLDTGLDLFTRGRQAPAPEDDNAMKIILEERRLRELARQKTKRTWMVVGGVVVSAVIIGGIIYFKRRGSKGK